MRVEKEALQGRRRRGGPRKDRAFLAYRMNEPSSKAMHDALNVELGRRSVQLLDGKLDGGEDWAPTIRRRIKESKVFVADVTGPSREVLFELGCSSNKPVLPIVSSKAEFRNVPLWISTTQLIPYEGAVGVTRVADRVAGILSSRSGTGFQRHPAVPGRVVWLHGSDTDWDADTRRRVELSCREVGADFRPINADDVTSPEDLRDILSGWLVFVLLDGGPQDYLAHYLLGDVVARRRAGSGNGKGEYIDRSAVILTRTHDDYDLYAADSVQRVSKNTIASGVCESANSIAMARLANFRAWGRSRHNPDET